MQSIPGNKAWGSATSAYNTTVSVYTSLGAKCLLDLVTNVKHIDHASHILDMGAGTGATTIEIAREYPYSTILATDISENMVKFVANLHIPNVSTQVLDAAEVDNLGDETFSHVMSTFMLQFMVRPDAAVSGAFKVLKPGGAIGLALWCKDIDIIVAWEKACIRIDPSYRLQRCFIDPNAWTTAEDVKLHLSTAGFVDIEVGEMYVPFEYPTAEAYLDFIRRGKLPSTENLISQWPGEKEQVFEVLKEIVRDEYGDGKDLKLHALLAVARKP